jgi:archaellum component FlaD/FlaE
MNEEKRDESQDKGFVVKDRRFSAKKEEEVKSKEEVKEKEPPKEDTSEKEVPLPEINFNSLILSLSTSALIQLGEIRDPQTNQPAKNLPLAKQTIDLIGLLKEKTKGNLTPDEEKLLDSVLFDLRMRYVRAKG